MTLTVGAVRHLRKRVLKETARRHWTAAATNMLSFLTENGDSPNLLNGGLQKLLDSPFGIFFVLFAVGRAFELETCALRPLNNFLSKNPKEMYPYDRAFSFQLVGFRPGSLDASDAVMHLYVATRTAVLKVAIIGCLLRSSQFMSRFPSNAKAGAWLTLTWFPPGLDQEEGTSCVPLQS